MDISFEIKLFDMLCDYIENNIDFKVVSPIYVNRICLFFEGFFKMTKCTIDYSFYYDDNFDTTLITKIWLLYREGIVKSYSIKYDDLYEW